MTVLPCDATHREASLEQARDVVATGGLVVLPTDTVYGLGADAFDADAVAALLAAKGRGRAMPPPVLVSSPDLLDVLGIDVPDAARALAEAFWPGALTLIVRAQPSLTWDLGETAGTVALRMPDEETALALLRLTGPLAVSSANRTGQAAATTAQEAREQLGGRVAVYLDGGPARGGVPSTIVSAVGDSLSVVRAGAITASELGAVVPHLGRTDTPEPAPEPDAEPAPEPDAEPDAVPAPEPDAADAPEPPA